MEKKKILMVCLGNICRSPLAEGVLKAKVDTSQVYVDSAGTSNYHIDDLPDRRSIATARKHNLDITDQRGRQLTKQDLKDFDHIFVMDNSNYRDAVSLTNSVEEKEKIKLILNEIFPGENVDVPDPYYGGDQGFENVYQMLDEATDKIIEKLNNGTY
ncbi:low molecular weight protein-tyrosine-phosphatase [Zunongwangia atlantica]|uniref:protein-tyrosine-phosphatase n=1 Tax=Zunongwangia atlantica 22II14-10F7 TaxID=1185767 RepID=A0A1Y1T0V4_9FLAO|nr:low molecular weight protein-tyrosine-phosphatase [Zunongwangia atlantica]ORL44234.1 low molecular weight phosphotyrosine protein phosphatase [Zunongwangia atlantica 22II14-10F7]